MKEEEKKKPLLCLSRLSYKLLLAFAEPPDYVSSHQQ